MLIWISIILNIFLLFIIIVILSIRQKLLHSSRQETDDLIEAIDNYIFITVTKAIATKEYKQLKRTIKTIKGR